MHRPYLLFVGAIQARKDPLAAAEAVAAEMGAARKELDDLTALRWEQYAASLADDRAFQRRYQVPVEIPQRKGSLTLDADEGATVDAPMAGPARGARMLQPPIPLTRREGNELEPGVDGHAQPA